MLRPSGVGPNLGDLYFQKPIHVDLQMHCGNQSLWSVKSNAIYLKEIGFLSLIEESAHS